MVFMGPPTATYVYISTEELQYSTKLPGHDPGQKRVVIELQLYMRSHQSKLIVKRSMQLGVSLGSEV